MFKQNEGTLDRVLRVILGVVLLPAGLLLLGGLQGNILGLLTAVPGVIGLVTGITGICPTYYLFGVSTLEKEAQHSLQSPSAH